MRQAHAANCCGVTATEAIRKTRFERMIPAGRPEGDEAAEESASRLRRVFHRHQDGAAPLAAERKSLNEPAGDEQHRRPHADRGVARQQADRKGRESHEQQRPDEHRLAPEPIAEMPHDDATERSRDEADRKRGKGGQRAGQLRHLREELRAKDHRGGGAVDEEVVPLDGRADGARQRHPPRVGCDAPGPARARRVKHRRPPIDSSPPRRT